MKKLILLTSIVLNFELPLYSQFYDDVKINKDSGLFAKNKVKSLKVLEYKFRKGERRGQGRLQTHKTINKLGQVERSIFNYKDGLFKFTTEENYEYDSNNVLISHVDTSVKHYDKQGRLIERIKGHERWKLGYDNSGNKVSETWFTLYPYHHFLDLFKYNEKGQMVEMRRFNNSNKLYFHLHYYYNERGCVTKRIRFNNRNDTTDLFSFKYDSLGRQIESYTKDYISGSKTDSFSETVYREDGMIDYLILKLSASNKMEYRKYLYEFYN